MKKKRMDSPWSQDPNEAQQAYLIRLCEILYRSRPLLAVIDTQEFKDFCELYSKDVVHGLDLLQKCVVPLRELTEHSIQNYVQVLGRGSVLNPRAYTPRRGNRHAIFELQEPTKKVLSIFNQLEQILARWKVHHWMANNSERIKWLYRRRELYPQILTQCAVMPVRIGDQLVTLPYVNIDWLVDLTYSCLFPTVNEKLIATRLSARKHHVALLHFSSTLSKVELMLHVAPELINAKIQETVQFVLSNALFFKAILGDELLFSQSFIDYLRANLEAKGLARKLQKTYAVKLRHFLNDPHILNLVNDPERLEYYGGLLRLLVTNVINTRLPTLVAVAGKSFAEPEKVRTHLSVATWLEQYRDIIASSFLPQSEWGAWVALQPKHKPIINAFSKALNEALSNTVDTRPAKVDGDCFPSGLVCFMDCFSGLVESERSNELSCAARDVLLFQLLCDKRNVALVACLEKFRPLLTPIFEAFNQEQALVLQQLMDLTLANPAEQLPVPLVEEVLEDDHSPIIHRQPRNLLPALEESAPPSQVQATRH